MVYGPILSFKPTTYIQPVYIAMNHSYTSRLT